MTALDRPPLVVGAGPVGLGAALFLAGQGLRVRVVEKRLEPSARSKALAVNPRTLDLLAPTGVTQRMLERGARIEGLLFHREQRVLARLPFAGIHPRHPFMLALSQASTERLLAEALQQAGVVVERGVELRECRPGPEVVLGHADGRREPLRCAWVLAADGAHSVARSRLGIDFPGTALAEDWHLADAPLVTSLAADHAHAFLLGRDAFLFMIRVVDDARDEPTGQAVWRVMGNRPDPLSHAARVVGAEQAGAPHWESSFRVAHRCAAMLARGGVYLAGDAAHVHSPLGARGLNLGLEDAWVFAELLRGGRLADYDGLRRPVDAAVVRRVRLMSGIPAPGTALQRWVRHVVVPRALRLPAVRRRMLAIVSGLDHELPGAAAGGTRRPAAR